MMLKHGIPLLLIASGVMFFAAGFLAPLTGGSDAPVPHIVEPKLPQIASIEVRGGVARDDRIPGGEAKERYPDSDIEQKTGAAKSGREAEAPEGGKDALKGEPDNKDHAEHRDQGEGGNEDSHASEGENGLVSGAYRQLTIGPLPAGDNQPWKIVRNLQVLQDDIAQGKPGSISAYREGIVRAGQIMSTLAPRIWNAQRNLDAAAIYLLIGGNPAVADIALSHTQLDENDRVPLEAARAYSRKELREAEAKFSMLDSESLPASARGQFALARSMIYSAFDMEQARKLLEEARRQAPGTLIEEAALRRLLRVAGEEADVEAFGFLARTYQARFRKSGYFGDFVRNFVLSLSMMPATRQGELVEWLEALCDTLPASGQLPVLGNVAKRATVDGKTVLAQWAAGRALSLLDDTSKFRAQFKLYLGAAQVVEPDKTSQAIALLEDINRDDLDRPNRLLLDAVLELSRRITGEPVNLQKAKALLGREHQMFPGDEPEMPVSEGELQAEVGTHRAVMRMKRLAMELEANGLGY